MYVFRNTNFWATQIGIFRNNEEFGKIHYSHFRGNAEIIIDQSVVNVKSRRWYSTKKVITQNGEETGNASFRMMSFKPRIEVQYRGHLFTLRAANMWQRRYDVYLEGQNKPIGSISKKGWFLNSYESELPESVDLWFQAVMVTLLITLSTYQSAAAS
ncbi:MAG: hypothetical protein LAT84_02015 [Balneolia bacterium]|nr:hypothetical protein [Balneolia bacterium]